MWIFLHSYVFQAAALMALADIIFTTSDITLAA